MLLEKYIYWHGDAQTTTGTLQQKNRKRTAIKKGIDKIKKI